MYFYSNSFYSLPWVIADNNSTHRDDNGESPEAIHHAFSS